MKDAARPETVLTVWTVYQSPSDYPGQWVLRGHDVAREVVDGQIVTGSRPHAACFVASTLEEVRGHLPAGLVRMVRNTSDDPAIYESWI